MKPLTDLANMYGDEAIDWIVENQYNYTLVENEKLSNSDCPDCEKVAKEKAAGIESYLASPLDFIKQKKEEFANVLKEGITFSGQTNSYLMNQSIFDWLEQLIKDLAAR